MADIHSRDFFRDVIKVPRLRSQAVYSLINIWTYYAWANYGRTNALPEILNNFVAPNMESVDPKN